VKLLLDTSTFLWVITDAPELSTRARESFVDSANDIYLSSVSAWEIAIKYALGRLPLPEPPERFIPFQREQHGIEPLPLEEDSALHLVRLPPLHKDPFDRMLVCQAIVHGLVILTPDALVDQYPAQGNWRLAEVKGTACFSPAFSVIDGARPRKSRFSSSASAGNLPPHDR